MFQRSISTSCQGCKGCELGPHQDSLFKYQNLIDGRVGRVKYECSSLADGFVMIFSLWFFEWFRKRKRTEKK